MKYNRHAVPTINFQSSGDLTWYIIKYIASRNPSVIHTLGKILINELIYSHFTNYFNCNSRISVPLQVTKVTSSTRHNLCEVTWYMWITFYKELAFGLAHLWNRPQVLNGITSDGSTSIPFFLFFLIKAKEETKYFTDSLNKNAHSLHHKSGTAVTEFQMVALKPCDSRSVLPWEYFLWTCSSVCVDPKMNISTAGSFCFCRYTEMVRSLWAPLGKVSPCH